MCGFLAEIVFKTGKLISKNSFEELLLLSIHRGSDATNVISRNNFQLGFNRLAIMDTSERGNQPTKSPTNRFYVVFNGEIYNFKELIQRYSLSELRSTSDTEVLVHLLDLLGVEETILVLNGMFSIVVVDTHLDITYLTRDFAGIKPMFYSVSEYGVVAASQFNQLFNYPYFKGNLKLRKEIVKEYFGLGYMQAPNTIYESIFQVLPGQLISINSSGTVHKKQLITFSKDHSNRLNRDSQKYEEILHDIIKRQLISDVPIATFLSGGIDSPLVSAIAKQEKQNLQAFTLKVADRKYDESKKAKCYADHIQLKQQIENIQPNDLLDQIDSHFKFVGEPFGDYSSVPTFMISKKAREYHTVMLSGDGGDELFLGYPRMRNIMKLKKWFYVPHFLRKPIIRVAIKCNLMSSWALYSYKNMENLVLGKHLQISQKRLDNIIPQTSFSIELKQLYCISHKQTNKSLLHQLRHNEFYGHLQRVLIKVDRMSMANSLEVRVPFLDKKSILWSWNWFPKMSGNNFDLKELLKGLMENYFPKQMIAQEKKGFAVPIEKWLQCELKQDLENVVLKSPIFGSEMIDVAALKNYVREYLENKHNEAWGVWHVYAWQKWAIAEGLIVSTFDSIKNK